VEPLALNRDPAFPSTVPMTVADASRANLTVAGWGDTSYMGSGSSDLLEVKIPAVSNSTCEDAYDWLQPVVETDLCAGFPAGGQNTCHGDSGGSLYADLGGDQISVGVVNWAYGCAWALSPTVYGRVSAARAFIDDHADGVRWVSPAARWHAALSSLN
jgi:secreted trypsin-like serine protease